jgi:hypothetical protein
MQTDLQLRRIHKENVIQSARALTLISESKDCANDVATPMRASLPMPSFSIQLMAALAGRVREAPIPRAYRSDWVANIMFIWDQKRYRMYWIQLGRKQFEV